MQHVYDAEPGQEGLAVARRPSHRVDAGQLLKSAAMLITNSVVECAAPRLPRP
jgi:hypothetical protein